jgi:hypothetical protein
MQQLWTSAFNAVYRAMEQSLLWQRERFKESSVMYPKGPVLTQQQLSLEVAPCQCT